MISPVSSCLATFCNTKMMSDFHHHAMYFVLYTYSTGHSSTGLFSSFLDIIVQRCDEHRQDQLVQFTGTILTFIPELSNLDSITNVDKNSYRMKTYINKSISSSSFHHPLTASQHTYKNHVGILEFGNDIIKHLDVVGVVLELNIDILVVVSQGCQALTYTSIKMRHMHMTIL